jgi:Spy/CpxP family protein refolding chaperone
MTIRSLLFALVAAAGIAAAPSITSAAEPSDAQRQALETKIQDMRERLALTPEQEQQLAPLLQARNAKLQELFAKRDPDASRREKRALLSEAKTIQDDFDKQIAPILTQEQMKQWQEFRKEARAAAIERYRNRQN